MMSHVSHRLSGFVVRVLGPAGVHRRGAGDLVRDGHLRTLLAALAAHANEPVGEAELVAAVWGDTPPANPRDSLETRLSRLRSVLAPEAEVGWTEHGYVLRVDPGRVDATRFERLVGQARAASPQRAVRLLVRALALWRGPALPELRRAGLDHPRARRLTELGTRAVEDLAEHELRLGRHEAAATRLLEAFAANPLRERMCALTMWALHSCGRTAEALAQYELLRTRLATALGVPPSLECGAVYRRIAGQAPEPARPRPRPSGTTFVGRDDELRRLATLVERDRLISLIGPGGSGKTRLARELLPTVDLPAGIAELATAEPGEVATRAAAALGVHAYGTGDDVTAALAEALAAERALLVLDGCEHVLTAVRALAKRLTAACPGLTVLATSRVRLGLGAERAFPVVPLDAAGAEELFLDRVRARTPELTLGPRDAAAVRYVLNAAERLPLTVEVAAAHAAAGGLGAIAHLPKDVVGWAFESLPPPGRDLVAALAVFPGWFDASAAGAVTGSPDGTAQLATAGLLTVDESGYRMPEFVHQFAERVLSHSASEQKLREQHARWVLDTIMAEPGRAGQLRRDVAAALRWSCAEDPALAAELSGRLGLLPHYASDVDVLTWRLRLGLSGAADVAEHSLALGSAARAAFHFGRIIDALALAERARARATTAAEHYLALHTQAVVHAEAGEQARALATCRKLLALDGISPAWQAEAHAELALLSITGGDLDGALGAAATARLLAEQARAPQHAAFARYAEAEALAVRDVVAGADALHEARTRARSAGATLVALRAGAGLATVLVRLGRLPEAAKLVVEAAAQARRTRSPALLHRVTSAASAVLSVAGEGGAVPAPVEEVARAYGIRPLRRE